MVQILLRHVLHLRVRRLPQKSHRAADEEQPLVRGKGLVTRAGEIRTLHDGDIQTGTDKKDTQRAADLQLGRQCGKATAAVHGELRGEPADHTGLRTAEKTGSVGNRGVHLHVRMLLPRHRSRAVTARYA